MSDQANSTSDAANNPLNWSEEEKYWQEHHAEQPHATEGTAFAHYAPAYRVGAEAAAKYPGKDFDEIEDEVALDYGKHQIGEALPWDHARGASRAAWSKVSGINLPRDPSRGIRGSI